MINYILGTIEAPRRFSALLMSMGSQPPFSLRNKNILYVYPPLSLLSGDIQ